MSGVIGSLWRTFVPERIRTPLYLRRRYGSVISRPGLSRDSLEGLYRFYRDRDPPLGPVLTPTGLRLDVDLRDHGVALPIFLQEDYEAPERNFLSRWLQPGHTVIDIGANIGYLATFAAQIIGDRGRVIAFEPEPWNFQLLCRNARQNRMTNIHPIMTALGESDRQATLHVCADNFGDHRIGYSGADRPGQQVTIQTGDNALKAIPGSFDLVKIDVQGYEPFVLHGLSQTLHQRPPRAILMEFWPHGAAIAGTDLDAAIAHLMTLGYKLHRIGDDGAPQPTTLPGLHAAIPRDVSELSQYLNIVLQHTP